MCIVNPLVYDMSPKADQNQWDNSPTLSNMEDKVEINNIEPMNTSASPSHKKKKHSQPQCARLPFFITN